MSTLLPGLQSAINIHPMVVHFPVAFWVAATLCWAVSAARKDEDMWRFGLYLHSAGAMTGVLAGASGFLATSIIGHDAPGHHVVHLHRDIMLIATGISVLVTALGWFCQLIGKRWRAALLALSVVQALVMTVGADRGGYLVYHMGIGVDAPAPVVDTPAPGRSTR